MESTTSSYTNVEPHRAPEPDHEDRPRADCALQRSPNQRRAPGGRSAASHTLVRSVPSRATHTTAHPSAIDRTGPVRADQHETWQGDQSTTSAASVHLSMRGAEWSRQGVWWRNFRSVVAHSTPLSAVARSELSDSDETSTGLHRVPVAGHPVAAPEHDAYLGVH